MLKTQNEERTIMGGDEALARSGRAALIRAVCKKAGSGEDEARELALDAAKGDLALCSVCPHCACTT